MNRKSIAKSVIRIVLVISAIIITLVIALGLVVRQPNFGAIPFPEGSRADSGNLRRHVAFLATDARPRNPKHPEELDRAAAYIVSMFQAHTPRVEKQPYAAGQHRCQNIIARFGPDAGAPIIIGAHYDVSGDLPGADDNASGVAGLLESARLLATRKLDCPVILVAYSTEEPPYFGGPEMGSAVHALELRQKGVTPKAMICLEMIGYFTAKQPQDNLLLSLLYPHTGDFVSIVGRFEDRALARQVKRAFRGATSVPVVSYSGPVAIGADLSDQRNYWAQGFFAVMVTDTAFMRNKNYHTAGDTPDSLDYRSMAGVVDGVLAAVIDLSQPD